MTSLAGKGHSTGSSKRPGKVPLPLIRADLEDQTVFRQGAGAVALDGVGEHQLGITADDRGIERLPSKILRHEEGAVAPHQNARGRADLPSQLRDLPSRRRLP